MSCLLFLRNIKDTEDSNSTYYKHLLRRHDTSKSTFTMCYLRETYHSYCNHWGFKKNISPCAVSLTQPGLSRGCWYSRMDGIENVRSECTACLYARRNVTMGFKRGSAGHRSGSKGRTTVEVFLRGTCWAQTGSQLSILWWLFDRIKNHNTPHRRLRINAHINLGWRMSFLLLRNGSGHNEFACGCILPAHQSVSQVGGRKWYHETWFVESLGPLI